MIISVLVLQFAAQAAGPIAVVVNSKAKIDDISTSDLRRIFLGEKTQWDGGSKIFAINFPADNELRQKFQSAVIGMSSDEIQKFWMDQKIKGKSMKQPNVQKTEAAAQAFVKKLPTAIAYVSLDKAQGTDGLKILKIDGKSPTDDGYLLK